MENFQELLRMRIQALRAAGVYIDDNRLYDGNNNKKFNDDIDDYACHTSEQFVEGDYEYPNIPQTLMKREIEGQHLAFKVRENAMLRLLPDSPLNQDVDFDNRVYNVKFSPTGDLLYCSSQQEIRIYDTSDPENWVYLHEIQGFNIRWTITDIDLSPCENFIVYSTIDSHVTLVPLSESIPFDNLYNQTPGQMRSYSYELGNRTNHFGIWSLKFSGQGNEVVGGTTQYSLIVHDLVEDKTVMHVPQVHDDDINTVCWSDRQSSNIIYTGSDDSTIKVWDRRTLGRTNNPEGVLVGHREGLTHISSKGDGVTLISNCKDQTLKLWDIRYMSSMDSYRDFRQSHDYTTGFDYRWSSYPLETYQKRLAADRSVMTFRGHQVLSTLIRCYFSPMESTAQRFIYTGSSDGVVRIYDSVTGKTVKELREEQELHMTGNCARDVSWHPTVPVIAATSFTGHVSTFTLNKN